MSVTEEFRAAMRAEKLDYPGPIVADGQLHRIKANGDRAPNTWYVLHDGFPPAGAFGCWKRSINATWFPRRNGNQFSPADWAAIRRRWAQASKESEREREHLHADARKKASEVLAKSTPAKPTNPYLVAKRVQPHGELRQHGDVLLVPLRDPDGALQTLQSIGPDGSKKFLPGGKVSGTCFFVADKEDGPLAIVEGYATGASIHEATDFATVAAMNCGNLLAVAKALRQKWPEREIIIAGDNDQFTEGNQGKTKATEAALTVKARLAAPQFKDDATKPTDFNDLAALEGLAEVKRQIELATVPEPPKESDDQAISRLAALPLLEYERIRETEAARLGCRPQILDKLIAVRRGSQTSDDKELQGRELSLPDPETWPEPVNGPLVLSDTADTFNRYLALPPGAADAMALFVAHTHCHTCSICSPRLNLTSPDKQCGKTVARDVTAELVPRPLPTENMSVAVLFRVVESKKPTILADEYDAWLGDNDEIRGMLNAGHRRGGQALRCEGEDNTVRAFSVFAPAVLCGIGALPGTLHDRSIVVRLTRAKPGEIRERFDSRHTQREKEICRKLARWTADNQAQLEACDPVMPVGAVNRLADNWRPLFAIAQVAGGDWPARAAAAFAALTATDDLDAQGLGTMLLADIRDVFTREGEKRLSSSTVADSLGEMEGRPWPEFGRARKPITPNQLAQQLRKFGIAPRMMRIPGEAKNKRGYDLADFHDAFARFVPEQLAPAETTEPVAPPEPQEPRDLQAVAAEPENTTPVDVI